MSLAGINESVARTIYVTATSSVPSIRPAKAGRILSLDLSPVTPAAGVISQIRRQLDD